MDTLERLETLLENYQTLVEERKKQIERLEEENGRLRAALTECAQDFDVKVKSYEAAYEIVSRELRRRFTVAHSALR